MQTSQIGTVLFEGNSVWDTVGANGALEEPSCGGGIATLCQHEIKGLPVTFQFWDTANAATLTVVILGILCALAIGQFFFLDRKVHYK